jgi:hypothetical protein
LAVVVSAVIGLYGAARRTVGPGALFRKRARTRGPAKNGTQGTARFSFHDLRQALKAARVLGCEFAPRVAISIEPQQKTHVTSCEAARRLRLGIVFIPLFFRRKPLSPGRFREHPLNANHAVIIDKIGFRDKIGVSQNQAPF